MSKKPSWEATDKPFSTEDEFKQMVGGVVFQLSDYELACIRGATVVADGLGATYRELQAKDAIGGLMAIINRLVTK